MIKCNVKNCIYNNNKLCKCNLDNIEVTKTCENCDKSETICNSFKKLK